MKRPMSMSRAVAGWIVLSGRTGHDESGFLGDAADQTRQALRGLAGELATHGAGFGEVMKMNVYLTDIGDYDSVNEVYSEVVPEPFPARTCVSVVALPGRASVEIEAWAYVGENVS